MSDTRIAVVVGNPRPGSRTRAVAESFAAALAEHIGAPGETIDLAELGPALINGAIQAKAAIEAVSSASLVIVATPVYKASFTGLLKLFLDQLSSGALSSAVAVPVSVSAAPTHRVLADLHLRPVLAELGASLPVPSFLVEEREIPDVSELAKGWASRHGALLRASIRAIQS